MSFTILGLTGPTGAGKTTVLRLLEGRGAAVLDCDAIYHHLTRTSAPMRAELEAAFGPGLYDTAGELQRKVLGEKVFGDPQALDRLNAITHRYVREEVEARLERARRAGKDLAVVDAIALLESGLGALCHTTVAVVARPETRVRRIMARDGIDEGYARKRVEAQKPAEFFQAGCQYTLHNDTDDPRQLETEAGALLDQILL